MESQRECAPSEEPAAAANTDEVASVVEVLTSCIGATAFGEEIFDVGDTDTSTESLTGTITGVEVLVLNIVAVLVAVELVVLEVVDPPSFEEVDFGKLCIRDAHERPSNAGSANSVDHTRVPVSVSIGLTPPSVC